MNDNLLPPLVQAALAHAHSRQSIRSTTATAAPAERSCTSFCGGGESRWRTCRPSASFAGARQRYIGGLTSFRGDDVQQWIAYIAGVTTRASRLARWYLDAVTKLQADWRSMLSDAAAPRSDAEIASGKRGDCSISSNGWRVVNRPACSRRHRSGNARWIACGRPARSRPTALWISPSRDSFARAAEVRHRSPAPRAAAGT